MQTRRRSPARAALAVEDAENTERHDCVEAADGSDSAEASTDDFRANPADTAAPVDDNCWDIQADVSGEPHQQTGGVETASSRQRYRLKAKPRFALIIAALVISAVSFGISVILQAHHERERAHRQAAADFTAAARQSVVSLMSLNFNQAAQDVARIIDNSTGAFKQDFEASAQEFVAAAKGSQVITVADVHATALESMSDDSAVVLLAVTTRVSNVEADADESRRTWRLAVDMRRDGDRLKMAKVEFVP